MFTGATREAAEFLLEHAGLISPFSIVVGSDEIAAVKPAPDGIYRARQLLEVSPSQVAYVGDAVTDFRCALAAGATPVGAAWGHLYDPEQAPPCVAPSPEDLVELFASRSR